jgi:hypothetical protein
VARRRALPIVLAFATLAGCALTVDLDGLEGPPLREDADAAEASPSPDGDVDGATPDGAPPPDAAPPCKPTLTVDAKLDATLGDWRAFSQGADGYPRVEAFAGGPAAVLLPKITIPPGAGTDGGPPDPQLVSARSGLWRPAAVPLAAFDLDLEAFVTCTAPGSCADGLVVAWIDATDLGLLDNANTGHMAGMPSARSGAAVVLDDYQNDPAPKGVSDPAPPSLQIIQLDATKTLGHYDWHVATTPHAFLDAWRKVHVTLRGDQVTVTSSGTTITGKVKPFARGLFGLTSGTGGETNAVGVRNVRAAFYACVP